MNPLTLVKRIQNINKKEASLGISEAASWHVKYKDSAYVYVGGIPFDLTEGDLLAVFAQYGEIVDVNLVRDKGTGKSKGFAFVAYEDQRSTNLAVDNLNGAQILGRIVRVDHVTKYKKLEEEDEETRQQKREERGVCRAFQKGECTRGDSCKFSHNEQRAANTGWGAEEDRDSRWVQDKFDGSGPATQRGNRSNNRDSQHFPPKGNGTGRGERLIEDTGSHARDHERRIASIKHRDVRDGSNDDKRSRKSYDEPNSRDRRDEKRSRKHESESYHREDRDRDKYDRERKDGDKYDRERDGKSGRHRRRDEDERR